MLDEQKKCSVQTTVALLENKWKLLILRELFGGTRRFTQLSRAIPGISQKMLTQQLRSMEKDELIKRQVFAEIPPRVDYSLTEIGLSLKPVLDAMHKWGEEYIAVRKNQQKTSS
jgi:DNA-binding HxlR family transcriptional regulator